MNLIVIIVIIIILIYILLIKLIYESIVSNQPQECNYLETINNIDRNSFLSIDLSTINAGLSHQTSNLNVLIYLVILPLLN